MKAKIAITGMGAVTPLGLNVADYWQNLVAGKNGVGPITKFNAERLPTRIAAEIHGFDETWHCPKNLLRSSSGFMRYALAAAEEALGQAGIKPHEGTAATGLCMGTALGGAEEFTRAGADYQNSSTAKMSPHLVPRAISNMAGAHLAIAWGFHGPGFTLSTACSAGGDALMTAANLILAGEADSMIVLAGECAIDPAIISSLAQAKALSRHNADPEHACRPFDLNRDGFIVGEGGGALYLETVERAKRRGAEIFAILAGWANTMDGYHITAPNPDGQWAAHCMRRALLRAGMRPDEIGYINAHGTGTKLGDEAETKAIKSVFGQRETAPPVSSTKGATGHLMSAGGLTEVIACVKALREKILPPTINLETADPLCDLDYIPLKARRREIKAAMSNSLGFGGQNSSIIVCLPDYRSSYGPDL